VFLYKIRRKTLTDFHRVWIGWVSQKIFTKKLLTIFRGSINGEM